MICIMYGLQGCGKSTTFAYVIRCNEKLKKRYERKMNGKKAARLRRKLEQRPNSKRLQKKWSKFSRINFYTTFYCTDPTVPGTVFVDFADLGKFCPKPNSCFLLEEAGIGLDSRNFAKLSKFAKRFFSKHRHQLVDIIACSQSVDIDKALRDRCDYLFHLKRIGEFTWIHRFEHKLIIDESTHDMAEGYFIPSFLKSLSETLGSALFYRVERNPMTRSRIIFRPLYYKYFDSFEDVFDYPMEDPAASIPDYKFVPIKRKSTKEQLQELGFKLFKGKKDLYYAPTDKDLFPDEDEEEKSFDDIIEAMFA